MGLHKIKGLERNIFIKNTKIPYTLENILRYKSKKMDNDCIIYTGTIKKNGYGSISFKNKEYLAHRKSYEFYYGKISKNIHVCHHCDNPPCINPKHLFLGTAKDNINDCIKKNRNSSPPIARGSKSNLSKLCERDVLEIKEKLKKGEAGNKIAKQYGVTRQNIYFIKSNKSWRHL
jgi:hypothetical protein